jgi:hypothetical protein
MRGLRFGRCHETAGAHGRGLPYVPLPRVLLEVENLFCRTKCVLRIRPVYHSSDAATRGHVFCSFLALILRKELDARCRKAGFRPEWGDVLLDLDRLQEVKPIKGGQRITCARQQPELPAPCSRLPVSPCRPTPSCHAPPFSPSVQARKNATDPCVG